MRRKITDKLIAWKNQKTKKPLVITGPRQTGKTYSIEQFAQNNYRNYLLIDFYKQSQLKAAFQGELEPKKIVGALEALLGCDIAADDTLLIFDEIQECDEAITSLKFFCTDAPEYDIVAAGSLLGVHVARNGSFPVGYVDMIAMHPMDFEEFCWAAKEDRALNLVRESFNEFSECVVHDHMMSIYRDYLMVGGMPEAVSMFLTTHKLDTARNVQETLSTTYIADMAKYSGPSDVPKIIACWDSVPAQLAKETESKKFQWKLVAKGARSERYAGALEWLIAAALINQCTQITDGVAPLKTFENKNSFKLYMGDTGLLSNAYRAVPSDLETKDHRSARFRGALAENYVMQQLVAADLRPYYWGTQSKHEVEFILRLSDGVVPIEVKSGERVKSTSASFFAEKYECPYVLRVTGKNFGKTDKVRNLPLYAAHLIAEL